MSNFLMFKGMKLIFANQGSSITCTLLDTRNNSFVDIDDIETLNVVTEVLNLFADNIKNKVVDTLVERA